MTQCQYSPAGQVNNYFNRVRQVIVERERKKHGPEHTFKDVDWVQTGVHSPSFDWGGFAEGKGIVELGKGGGPPH